MGKYERGVKPELKRSQIVLLLAAGLIFTLAAGLIAFDDPDLETEIDNEAETESKPAPYVNAHFTIGPMYNDTEYVEIKNIIRKTVQEIGCNKEFMYEIQPTRANELSYELRFICLGLENDPRLFSLADSLDGVSYEVETKPVSSVNAHFYIRPIYNDTEYVEIKNIIRKAAQEIGCDKEFMSEIQPTRANELSYELRFICPGLENDPRLFSLADSLDGVSYYAAGG